jgi:hypothetical protein
MTHREKEIALGTLIAALSIELVLMLFVNCHFQKVLRDYEIQSETIFWSCLNCPATCDTIAAPCDNDTVFNHELCPD